MTSVEGGMNQTKALFLGILVIGLIGLLFLVIYGNLDGNLGFPANTGTVSNASVTLTNDGNIPVGLTGLINPTLSNIIVTNQTGTVIDSGNYTVSVVTFSNATTGAPTANYNDTEVFVNASFSSDSARTQDTSQVIGNLTEGAVSFFSFSNVWFILGAIALLIVIVVAIIGLVSKIGGNGDRLSS